MQYQTTFLLKSSCSRCFCAVFLRLLIGQQPCGFPLPLLGLHFQFGVDRCQMQSLPLGKSAQLKLPVIFQSELPLPCSSYSPFPFSLHWHYSNPATAALLFPLFAKSNKAAHRAIAQTSPVWGIDIPTSQFRRGLSGFFCHVFPCSCPAHTTTGFVG